MAKKVKLSRHENREIVYKLLFAKEFDCETPATDFYAAYDEESEVRYTDYTKDTFFGVCENKDEIDKKIEMVSHKWKVSRMSVSTKTILRLAVYEMLYSVTPPKVAINEAVEIAKKYDDEEAPSFINGILNKIARENSVFEENTSAEDKNAVVEIKEVPDPENGLAENKENG
mgnify:FL=1